MAYTLTMRDVAAVCELSDYACRKLFRDSTLSNFVVCHGKHGGNGRRFWSFAALLVVLRQKSWFTQKMQSVLAHLDQQRRL